MRGKIRDKRVSSKKDSFSHEGKREDFDRRRPYKRDSRTTIWPGQDVEDNDYELDELDELDEAGETTESEVRLPIKK